MLGAIRDMNRGIITRKLREARQSIAQGKVQLCVKYSDASASKSSEYEVFFEEVSCVGIKYFHKSHI